MEYNGISTTLINGSMSLEERNLSLQQFRTEKQMLISTDAGGEGLNLQCSHVVINYDLPWNPMKIEQRIGRADRIGQQSDVLVYNFILKDTIENRVRTVLEEKLAVICRMCWMKAPLTWTSPRCTWIRSSCPSTGISMWARSKRRLRSRLTSSNTFRT